MQTKKTHKVRINALFHRLQINKNIKFQTRILWKRRTSALTQIRIRGKPDWSTTSTDTQSSTRTSRCSSTSSTIRARECMKTKMYVFWEVD